MNKIKSFIIKHRILTLAIIFLLGIGLGYLFFTPSSKQNRTEKGEGDKIYTCSMHPQIRQNKPGKCPLCGMDLVEVGKTGVMNVDPNSIMLTDEAMALANIETIVVWKEEGEKNIKLYGNVDINQRTSQVQSSYVNGRVEKLFINAVGDKVRKGQTIATIYSPEVYTASRELVSALNYPDKQQSERLVQAAKEKLLLWNVSETQISTIIKNKKATPYISLVANTSGTVIEKNVNQGDYIQQGKTLFTIADLSTVWILLKVYEQDLPFLKVGQSVSFTCDAIKGKIFAGKVSFINPVLDAKTRTTDVRIEMANTNNIFSPQMYVTAEIKVNMQDFKNKILIPQTAVLWTGSRSIVYVKDPEQTQPTFTLREVELGENLGGEYIVLNGLEEGEEIASQGVFQIDASAQLEGKKSMMNE